jgi:hypothetical protein
MEPSPSSGSGVLATSSAASAKARSNFDVTDPETMQMMSDRIYVHILMGFPSHHLFVSINRADAAMSSPR